MVNKKILASILAATMVMSSVIPAFAAETCQHEDTYTEVTTKEPTCTETGIGNEYCYDCGAVIKENVTIDALGHDDHFAKVTKEPTATESGILQLTCSRCGNVEEKELPNDPATCEHENTDVFNSVADTCTTNGHEDDEICLDCGKTLQAGEDIIATGHVWEDDPSEVVDATCDKDGKKVYHCWNCDETKEETIKATGHEYGDFTTVKEATCETEGEEQATCSKCGDVIKKTIPALGHKWNDGEVTTEPTTTSVGVKTFTCTVCGNTKTEEIAKLPDESKPAQPENPSTGKKDDTQPAQPSTDKKQDTTTVVNPTKPATKKEAAKVGTKFVVAGQSYKVTKAGKEVSFIAAKKNAKSVSVPATVKSKGITYKVSSIAPKAIKGNKVKTVTIGTNVKAVANNAFFKCSVLKKVTIKSVKLTKKTASKKAFKAVNKKVVVKVPKKVKKSYVKIFKGMKIK